MAVSKDQLEKFIQTVLEIKSSKRSVVHSPDDLKQIAFEMGFTEDDWQEYLREYQKHLTAGRSFLEHNNPGDAALHLEKAVTLHPYGLEANALLAETYKQQFLKTRKKSDKNKAIEQARNCLKIDNKHAAAYQLISELKQTRHRRSTNTLIIISIVLVAIAAASVLFFFNKTDEPIAVAEVKTPVTDTIAEEISPEIFGQSETVLVKNKKSEGMEYISELSEISDYSNSYSFKLLGYIKLKGIEVDALKLKIEVLDEDERIVFSSIKEPVKDYWPAFRSGDLIPVDYLEYVENQIAPSIKKVRISVQTVSKEPAAPQYESSRDVDYSWAYERPANFDIEIRERHKSLSRNYTDKVYYTLALEAENTGNTAIKTLQTEIEWIDYSGNIIESKTTYFTTSSKPKIKRGHTRVNSGTWLIPVAANNLKGYRIKITDLR